MYVFDVEADGLDATKIHCLVYGKGKGTVSITDYNGMKEFLLKADTLIGHNICRYDIPTLERLLEIKIEAKLIDTLALSWYLEPTRKRHGLEFYGEDFGVPKPVITDWEGLSGEEYVHRCREDVKINTKLWEQQHKQLVKMYDTPKELDRFLRYIEFKMNCAAQQEKVGWKLDLAKARHLEELWSDMLDTTTMELIQAMPDDIVYAKRQRPTKPYKKDGSLSAAGERWFHLLNKKQLPSSFSQFVEEEVGAKPPNPGSHPQVKNWLRSLGWKPQTFKHDGWGDNYRKIPQIKLIDSYELCPSVLKLAEKEPAIKLLEGYYCLIHRLNTMLKSFIKFEKEGRVKASIGGLTNTLRFKHAMPCVNIPGVDKPYGKDIRELLICEQDQVMCGADMTALEDRIKHHYMYPHDPEYVDEMSNDDYDPHLDICEQGGLLTPQQVREHKDGLVSHSGVRHKGKTTNYACQYGAKPSTVATSAGISIYEAINLVDTYWKRNWAIEEVAKEQITKKFKGKTWLFNPVSRFWYSLRAEKDRFSTLVQGTGVYCFDMWLKNVDKTLTAQFHDEGVWCIPKTRKDDMTNCIRGAIDKTNDTLKLNRELDVDIQFGNNYAEIH